MNQRFLFAVVLVVAVVGAFAVGRWLGTPAGDGMDMGGTAGEREILYWRAPMDPNY
nr:hypothetical protein [Burkholderiales bacterium]